MGRNRTVPERERQVGEQGERGEQGRKNMVELRNVSKAYKNNILFTNLNITVPRGDICGILGEKGSRRENSPGTSG